jgi:hypothetical protein
MLTRTALCVISNESKKIILYANQTVYVHVISKAKAAGAPLPLPLYDSGGSSCERQAWVSLGLDWDWMRRRCRQTTQEFLKASQIQRGIKSAIS